MDGLDNLIRLLEKSDFEFEVKYEEDKVIVETIASPSVFVFFVFHRKHKLLIEISVKDYSKRG